MTILELSGFFVAIKRVCSRLFTAYRGNIVGRHRLFDSPRRPEAADRIGWQPWRGERVLFDRGKPPPSMDAPVFDYLLSMTARGLSALLPMRPCASATLPMTTTGSVHDPSATAGTNVYDAEPDRGVMLAIFLHGDGPSLHMSLKTTTQCGVCSLEILQGALNALFEILGVNAAILERPMLELSARRRHKGRNRPLTAKTGVRVP
jgi:hypothetical protein